MQAAAHLPLRSGSGVSTRRSCRHPRRLPVRSRSRQLVAAEHSGVIPQVIASRLGVQDWRDSCNDWGRPR